MPENPLRLLIVIVDAPSDPWLRVSEDGFAEMLKSGEGDAVTVTETVEE